MAIPSSGARGWWGQWHVDRDAALQKREIRRLWRLACQRTDAAQWIPTPTGPTIVLPMIRDITLGNPTSLLVELRLGQLPSDIEGAAARIASSMGVADLRVSETPYPMWLKVEFLDHPASDAGVVTPFPGPASGGPARQWRATGGGSDEVA
jgi:hypothetical protein